MSEFTSGPAVADLAERYTAPHVAAHCKESTAEGVRQLLDKHPVPESGKLPLSG